jgi:hypothetical protein
MAVGGIDLWVHEIKFDGQTRPLLLIAGISGRKMRA